MSSSCSVILTLNTETNATSSAAVWDNWYVAVSVPELLPSDRMMNCGRTLATAMGSFHWMSSTPAEETIPGEHQATILSARFLQVERHIWIRRQHTENDIPTNSSYTLTFMQSTIVQDIISQNTPFRRYWNATSGVQFRYTYRCAHTRTHAGHTSIHVKWSLSHHGRCSVESNTVLWDVFQVKRASWRGVARVGVHVRHESCHQLNPATLGAFAHGGRDLEFVHRICR